MGLIDKLQNDGSPLSVNNGQTPPTNPLATVHSQLHATHGGGLGASMDVGINSNLPGFAGYRDGVQNAVPQLTSLSKNGEHATLHNVGQGNASIMASAQHANAAGSLPGYSLNSGFGPGSSNTQIDFVLNNVLSYDDGVPGWHFPSPSTLDMDGTIPYGMYYDFNTIGNP